ncbi:Acetyltransferase (GNAT) family protein [Flagellimonas taeanensis]|uniref:Acetyltransferase (GNAT) family protein n=1 Tax=Flagellimonas taeanensis TaxID=1005926 RepID=A0A1M7AIA2_9FLAO|nr:GNAT family N-acetyltransferase [Allomuricauda taeanensis]SFC33801.1 Acetyltransferase (GNAT) family protein [Allomuricauda taeanensis]SHL42336.1 Acetyltransferase (GNAT) family protein [Allomuricauda taeanensis]
MPISDTISVIPYSDSYQQEFKELNEAWITKYFKMEKMDYTALDHPKEYILDKGGYIAVAILDNQAVGVCALIPSQKEGYDFELAKMGVSEHLQGKGIGKLLARHVIDKAKEMGAKKLYLESNRVLGPALSLYQKLGFKEMIGATSPYERSDIQMELHLDNF